MYCQKCVPLSLYFLLYLPIMPKRILDHSLPVSVFVILCRAYLNGTGIYCPVHYCINIGHKQSDAAGAAIVFTRSKEFARRYFVHMKDSSVNRKLRDVNTSIIICET